MEDGDTRENPSVKLRGGLEQHYQVLQRDECLGDGKTSHPVVCNFTAIILGVTIHVTLGLPYGQGTADPGSNKTAVHKACAKLVSEPDSVCSKGKPQKLLCCFVFM